MESRKYQLQKQIIEAQKANDSDLYSLLKSQWTHRFGVESLEELKELDLNEGNQKLINEDNQENDQSKNHFFEEDKATFIKDDDKEKEIIDATKKLVKSVEAEDKELNENKPNKIVHMENPGNKVISPVLENKNPLKVEKLIPLPPKPKYGFLRKWLLTN